MPVAHGEGCYYADAATSTGWSATAGSSSATSTRREARPASRAAANPNGSLHAIAGVLNATGNVAGLMPHPERAADALLGSDDGMLLLRSLVESAAARVHGAGAVVAAGTRTITTIPAVGGR